MWCIDYPHCAVPPPSAVWAPHCGAPRRRHAHMRTPAPAPLHEPAAHAYPSVVLESCARISAPQHGGPRTLVCWCAGMLLSRGRHQRTILLACSHRFARLQVGRRTDTIHVRHRGALCATAVQLYKRGGPRASGGREVRRAALDRGGVGRASRALAFTVRCSSWPPRARAARCSSWPPRGGASPVATAGGTSAWPAAAAAP
jgi:hypothetical protein